MKKHKIKNHSGTNIEAPEEILRKAVKDCEGKMSKESEFSSRQLIAISVLGIKIGADKISRISLTSEEFEVEFSDSGTLTYYNPEKMDVKFIFGEVDADG